MNAFVCGFCSLDYAKAALSFFSDNFYKRLLEVPVGTAILICEKYKLLSEARIVAIVVVLKSLF